MKKSNYLFTSILPLALISSTALFSEAQAGIESAFLYQRGDGDCMDDQSRMQADWRPNTGRLKLGGEGTFQIEAFGPFMDMSNKVDFSGLPLGASGKIVRSHNGNDNFNHNCGANGSVVFEVTLPKVSGPNNGIIIIGNEQIPIALYPNQFELTAWDRSKNKSESIISGTNTSGATSNFNPNTSTGVNITGSGTCAGGTTGNGCSTATSSSYVMGNGSANTAPNSGNITKRTLTRCGYEYGLKSEVSAETLLKIELPEIRTALLNNCGNFGIFANYYYRAQDGRSSKLRSDTVLNSSITTTNGLPVTHVLLPDENGLSMRNGDVQFYINKSFLENFVGVKQFEIDVLPTYNDRDLKLELKSKPEFGPKNVSSPIYPQNIGSANSTGRLQSNITFKVTPYYAANVSQAYNWKILSNQVSSIATCFTDTSGRVNSSVGANLIEIPLTIKENETCYNKQFSFEVYTNTNPVLGANTLFDKTVNFTLPPLTNIISPQNNTPTVTAPSGVRIGN